ncbi:MurR/RpiR family transcriptional regulator [Mesorhizobium cantuariense]|uniref:MurR/RpiR family transcriptional regulator n=1 Tax=Mesorhizobium cantuariense TaxID=1300275 RepID=A0ABV7MYT3_9HYPH
MTHALIASLRAAAGDMTPALARVADTVLAQPEATLRQSITELAEASASSEASVMRFCRDQGFTGFQDFKLALAKELATDERARDIGLPTDDIQRLVETAIISLRETEQLIVREDIARAARQLLAATAIDCFGIAASAITAQYLAYKMTRIGKLSRALGDAHLAVMAAGTTQPGTVQVVISSSGSTIDAVRIAELARSQGAFVIGISNRSKSPLVAACDLALIASWPETPLTGGAFPSKISQLLIVDALVAEMTRQDPARLVLLGRTAEVVSDRSF